jgi:hypothetical protein
MAWSSEVASETPKDTGRKPRNPRKKVTSEAAERMAAALNFVNAAVGKEDSEREFAKHVKISNNWMVAYDGLFLAAGFPIEEELTLCPHYERLSIALAKAGGTLALTALDNGRLQVRGDKLTAIVPCLPLEDMPPIFPDAPIASIDDRLKEGFRLVNGLAKDDADTLVEATVLLRAGSMVSTNRHLMFEYWHGIDLPPGLAIPQRAAKMLSKMPIKLERFGFTPNRSATFYFEGGAWVRTQLYSEQWPDVDTILNAPFYGEEVPGLFDALDAVIGFSEDGAVHFHDDKLKSTYGAEGENGVVFGASYDLPGLRKGTHVNGKLLKLASPAAKLIDYTSSEDRMLFRNDEAMLRGVLMKRV